MSNSVQPHKRQHTRLLRPWDSPGKNTGLGCHFLLQCTKVKSAREVAQSCPTLRDPMDCSLPGSSVHGIFQARVLEWVAIAFSISRSIGPFQCLVNVNYSSNLLDLSFQSSSLFFVFFGFLSFQASSVPNFCPDTRGRRWSLYLGSLVQLCCGEGGTLQTSLRVSGVLKVCGPH